MVLFSVRPRCFVAMLIACGAVRAQPVVAQVADLAAVPPAHEASFAKALQAWQPFAREDERLGVGVIDASSSNQPVELLDHSLYAGSKRDLERGSVVTVALDLDNSRLYYGIDGKWIVGDPSTGAGGMRLKKGRDYYSGIRFYSGRYAANQRKRRHEDVVPGTWTGRFAAPEFQYPIPAGFRPYQSGPDR
jgi:hypothetical protein